MPTAAIGRIEILKDGAAATYGSDAVAGVVNFITRKDLDGFEVCRRLKANAAVRDIPVIFLTTLQSADDEERGLSLGAEDFIHKPFSPAVVIARVRNHLALSRASRLLRSRNEDLELAVAERTRRMLAQSEELMRRKLELIAAQDATVVAVEDISPEGIEAAVTYLNEERNIADVALLGASAGAGGTMGLVSQQPDLPDQIILLSPNSVVDGLGASPKLFIASEDEPVADVSTQMADTAEGDDNEAIILPGSAHAQNIFDTDQAEPTMTAILDRLNEFAN